MPISDSNTIYRLLLKTSVKLMLGLGTISLLVVFYGYLFNNAVKQQEILPFPLADMIVGKLHSLTWNGHRVLVLRRDKAMIRALQQTNSSLLDSNSRHSRQPQVMLNQMRSLQPDYFIALDYGTDLGCPLELVPADVNAPVSPWWGGFRDRCRGSWYDLAGRVYKGQTASRNLEIPAHSIEGDILNLGNNSISE